MLSIGDTAVRHALARGADGAEAFLVRGISTSVDIEGDRISHPMRSTAQGMSVRVLKEGRLGFAYCTRPDRVDAALGKALEISRLGKVLPFRFPERAPCREPAGTSDERLTLLSAEDAIRLSAEMMASARERGPGLVVTGGGVDFGHSESALVNSGGVAVSEKGTAISASVVVTLKGRATATGFEGGSSRRLDLDHRAMGQAAARLCLASRNPVPTTTGPRPVLFSPEAAADLLGSVLLPAIDGEAAGRGESVFSGRLGRPVMDPGLTMIDDGLLEGGLGTASTDDEGVPSRKSVVVESGTLRGFLFDLYSAAEFGASSTGNGARGSYRAPPSVSVRNLVLEGDLRDRRSLIQDIDDGILVHEVLGAHTADRASGDFSVNVPLLFRIRRGEVGTPLKPVMLSGNLPALLGKAGLGSDRKQVARGMGGILVGSLRLDDVMVTG